MASKGHHQKKKCLPFPLPSSDWPIPPPPPHPVIGPFLLGSNSSHHCTECSGCSPNQNHHGTSLWFVLLLCVFSCLLKLFIPVGGEDQGAQVCACCWVICGRLLEQLCEINLLSHG
uniref:Uncharacterized protein n=1 Tax=Anguilla anguilla TaxID=7936 RepID=A0A0E9WHW4_ANGAN